MSAFGEVSTLSFRLWRRHLHVFLRLWKSDAVPVFAEPFVILTVSGIGLGQLIDDVDGRSYLHFIGPGILGAYVMFAPTFENSWGSYIRMAVRRIYDAIIATPLSIEDVITGEILWGITRALIMGTLILIILAVIGAVESLWALLVLPFTLLQGFLFASMAMTYTALAPSVNSFNFFYSLYVFPMFFFAGVFFPTSDLPDGVREFSWVLPLTPAVHVSRGLVTGELAWSMAWSVVGMIGAGLLFYYAALKLMRRRLIT